MEQFKQGFIEEAIQLVDKLEEIILGLEERSITEKDIQEIFRIMHTIKGSSAMFSFSNTEHLAHKIEDVYDKIRSNELQINAKILDLTVQTTDILKELLNNDDKPDTVTQNKLVELFSSVSIFSSDEEEKTDHDEFSSQFAGKKSDSPAFYYIFFKPDSDVLKRGVSPLGVFEELADIGQVSGLPFIDDVPLIEDYDTSGFYTSWDIFLKTKSDKEEIEDIFMFYMDNEYKIIEINLQAPEENEEFLKICLALNRGDYSIQQIKDKLASEFSFVNNVKTTDSPTEVQADQNNKTELKTIESIKVESKKLDDLINLVSELVTLNSRLEIQTKDIDDDQLKKTINSVSKLSKRFRDNALELRLIPVKVLILKLQRLVRDLSKSLNKEIQFITEGTNTQLDKNIISKIEAPLMHILRNSIDHGIECSDERLKSNKPAKGIIRFIAFYSGSHVFIQIQDDGRGIDVEKVKEIAIERDLIPKEKEVSKKDIFNLLFSSGFSTSKIVTNVSGRGVGLDVVKKEISEMRGEIDIESEKGLGTSFTLKLPLTLSIIDTLMVTVNNSYLLFPREFIVQTNIHKTDNESISDSLEFEDKVIPVISLRDDFKSDTEEPEKQFNIIVKQYEKNYAIRVDKIIGEHQAVVKPLGFYNQNHDYFSGASILGDGSLAFIIDINKVINIKKSRNKVGNYNLK